MIQQQGKTAKEWLQTRREWVKLNPPNHQGFWVCGLCGRWVHESEMELDHIEPRGSHPELRYEHSNLQPTHIACNRLKGSQRVVQREGEPL